LFPPQVLRAWRWSPGGDTHYWVWISAAPAGQHGETDCLLAVAEDRETDVALRSFAPTLLCARASDLALTLGASPSVLILSGGMGELHTTQTIGAWGIGSENGVRVYPVVVATPDGQEPYDEGE